MNKCPKCGKFLKNVEAKMRVFDEKISVTGRCKTHGQVEPTDWDADDFRFSEADLVAGITNQIGNNY